MNINDIVTSLRGCSCGREHRTDIRAVEIHSGITASAGELLGKHGFPKKILFVADRNTIKASAGITESLLTAGFALKEHLYGDLRVADMEQVEELEGLCADIEGILSVGTGSLNDICRLAAFRQNKEFAIFATAPSMDGFASNSSPITKNNFKVSYPARQPSVILADTKILADSPAELKSAGFGDMIGKYTALADWRISHLLTGEHYCEAIAALSEKAVNNIASMAERITARDEEAAAAVMESLVLSGLCMGLENSVRPASGAEHVLSHFWEVKKLQEGRISDFHGKKVGVATVLINKIYREMTLLPAVEPARENLDWNEITDAYGEGLADEMLKANRPSVTDGVTPAALQAAWGDIRQIVDDTLPADAELLRLMAAAGAPVTPEEIGVSASLCAAGLKYSAFMRHRLTLMRLKPMLRINECNS